MPPKPGTTREGESAEGTNANAGTDGHGEEPAPRELRPGLEGIVANRLAQLEDELNEGQPEGAERITASGDQPEPEDNGGQEGAEPPPADEGAETLPPVEGEGEPATPPPAASEAMAKITMEDGTVMEVPVSKITTTVKLDGEAIEVAGNDLTSGFQLAKTSHARFRAANETLAEAQRLTEQTGQPPAQQQQPAQDTTPQAPDQDLENDPAYVEFIETLQFGDATDAAKKFSEIMARRQPDAAPAIDPQQIVQQAVAVSEQNRLLNEDLNAVAGRYNKIFEDDFLWQQTAGNVHHIRAEHLTELGINVHGLPPEQVQARYAAEQAKGTVPTRRAVFFAAAERTAEWVKRFGGTIQAETSQDVPPAQQQTTPPQNGTRTFQRKAEEKRGMQTPPTPSSGARNQPPPAQPAQSGSDIVAEMRRQRGQA